MPNSTSEKILAKVCSYIKKGCIYCDTQCYKRNGRWYTKYKLSGMPIRYTDTFVFFISSSKSWVYRKNILVKVSRLEWINGDKKHVSFFCNDSYFDLTQYDITNSREIALKMVNPKNRFENVAELPDFKFKELQEILRKGRGLGTVPANIKRIIANTLDEYSDSIMKRLGI